MSGVSFKVEQVKDAKSIFGIGFSSGYQKPSGSYTYQFNQAGVFYYWSGYVESTSQILFRGIVNVSDTNDKQLELNVKLNGFTAQKCMFPFNYKSNSYSECTNQTDISFKWCSPTQSFSGQIFQCGPIGFNKILTN